MPRKRKGLSAKTVKVAKMVAAGERQKDVAEKLGLSKQAVSKAVNAVLNYEAFEDIRNCRLIANRRLDSLRRHLLGLLGMVDDDEGGKPPKPGHRAEIASHSKIAGVLVQIEKRRAEMFGFDAPKHVMIQQPDPLENMTPEELLANCESFAIPVPAGLREEVERRKSRSNSPAQDAAGSAPPAGQ